MIYFFCGLPSSHSIFISRLGVDIIRESFGDFHYIVANTLDQLRYGLSERRDRHCVTYSDVPDDRICQSIVQHGFPAILVSEPVEQAVIYSMEARGLSTIQALRFVSQSAASLYTIASAATIEPLRLPIQSNELESLIGKITLALGITLTSENVSNLLRLYGYGPECSKRALSEIIDERIEHAADARKRKAIIPKHELDLIRAAASNYDPVIFGQPVVSITWPIALFLNGDKPFGPVTGPIDLTGPARALSIGPYMHLPKGSWRVVVTFSVRQNYSGNTIMLDAVSDGGVSALGKAALPPIGSFTTSTDFEVCQPHLPVEVRTFIGTGAIEGEFELLDVTIFKLT